MLKNYLLIAIRNLQKNKFYTSLNVFGLMVGITCALCIFLFVKDELSYDRYHGKSERIFRIIQGGDSDEQSSSMPFPTGPTLINDYPDLIEESVRLFNFQASTLALVYEGQEGVKNFNEPRFFFADSTYFKVFDHRFIAGDPKTALDGPGKMVITASTAKKYFGDEDALGKMIRFEGKHDLSVSAIIEDVPSNSHFKFDFLASFNSLKTVSSFGIPENNWYWNPVWTYVLLKKKENAAMLEKQMPFFVDKYYHPSLKAGVKIFAQPLTEIYLKARLEYEIGPMSDIRYVYIFSIVGVAILIIACINFINLTTAHSAERFKEIGVRKAMGAFRSQLASQFLVESFVVTTIASILALGFTAVLLPYMNSLAEKEFELGILWNGQLLLGLLATAILVGLIAGSYPSFLLSSLEASKVLKAGPSDLGGRSRLRQILVVFQFATSMLFIAGTIIAFQQINYMRETKLGFDGDQIIMLPVQRLSVVPKFDAFREQIQGNSNIVSVSASDMVVGKDNQASNYKREGEADMVLYPCLYVRNNFVETMGLKLLAGRDFLPKAPLDTPKVYGIINRSLAKTFGWENPEDAIEQVVEGTLEGKMKIVGVVEDFHYANLRNEIGSLMIVQNQFPGAQNFFTKFIMIRVKPGDFHTTVAFLETQWKQFVAEAPFDYFFLDDKLDQIYRSEEKFGRITTTFSIVAVSIACLGLLGLAAFSVQKRRKEIGVRKVLGASVRHIVRLLSTDFVKLLLIAFVISVPTTWYLMDRWLQGFAYKINIQLWVFGISLGVVLAIALATVSLQTVKAALENPIKSLKTD